MTQQEKQLLLTDLSARLQSNVIINTPHPFSPEIMKTITGDVVNGVYIEQVKPYLRPLSSMTEKEKEELNVHGFFLNNNTISNVYTTEQVSVPGFKKVMKEMYTYFDVDSFVWLQEFFNSYHLDYRGLIPMGLALEASANMYKTE